MSSRSACYFVTGTDTGVGKTRFCTALLRAAAREGKSTAAVKPVAAGSDRASSELRNEDALALQREASIDLSYEVVNPVCFEPAIAPHIAAARVGHHLTLDRLAGFCRGVMMKRADLTLIEGAGGWHVPLSFREKMSGLPVLLNVPVILVVGMRLGCLNHALLSAQAILADRAVLAGWVANRIDPQMECYDENLDTLKEMMPCPLLAEMPFADDPADLDHVFAGLNLLHFFPLA